MDIPPENVYIDHLMDFRSERKQLHLLKQRLSKGDLLYVVSLDRLGRTYMEVGEEWKELTHNLGVYITLIDAPLVDTRRDVESDQEKQFLFAEAVQQLIDSIAKDEKARRRDTVNRGIARAKEQGVQFGRPRIEMPEKFDRVYTRWVKHEISGMEAAKLLGISKNTFYRRANPRKNG